jgi:hypothetical protein
VGGGDGGAGGEAHVVGDGVGATQHLRERKGVERV